MINPASLHGVSLQRLLDMLMAFTVSLDSEGIDAVRAEIQRRDDNQRAHTQRLTEEVKRQNSALRKANGMVDKAAAHFEKVVAKHKWADRPWWLDDVAEAIEDFLEGKT